MIHWLNDVFDRRELLSLKKN